MIQFAGHSTAFDRALSLMPGGVNSPVRSFAAVGGAPVFIERAEGAWLESVDGRQLIDLVGSWGAAILGHGHPAVRDAIRAQSENTVSIGLASPRESDLAEEIIARVPSVQRVRFVNSGTEAVMSALRLARHVTGRRRIVRFEGGYHGHADALLSGAGSGVSTLGLDGEEYDATSDVTILPYNDIDAVKRVFDRIGAEIAGVILEPISGNMGVVPGDHPWLRALRNLTRRSGSVLIFDEVMTGFRVADGGAQSLLGVHADLTTLGKVIGGGLPVGAFGGSADLMDQIAPAGPVYQAGTMSGNPLTMAAGLAALRALDESAYAALERAGKRLQAGLEQAIQDSGFTACVQRQGSMLTLFPGLARVQSFSDANLVNRRQFSRFFHAMLRRGVHLPPSPHEAWFVSLAHDDEIIDAIVDAAAASLRELRDLSTKETTS